MFAFDEHFHPLNNINKNGAFSDKVSTVMLWNSNSPFSCTPLGDNPRNDVSLCLSLCGQWHLTNLTSSHPSLIKLSELSLQRHIHAVTNQKDHVRPMFVHIRAMFHTISTISLILDVWSGSNFHWKVMHDKQKSSLSCLIIGTILEPYSPLTWVIMGCPHIYHVFASRYLQ